MFSHHAISSLGTIALSREPECKIFRFPTDRNTIWLKLSVRRHILLAIIAVDRGIIDDVMCEYKRTNRPFIVYAHTCVNTAGPSVGLHTLRRLYFVIVMLLVQLI